MPTITADLGSNSVPVAALAGVIDSSVPLLLLGTDSGLVGPLDQGTGITTTITQGANTVVLTMADGTGSRLNANGVNLDLFAEIRLPLPGGLVQGAPAETIAWTGSVGGVAFRFVQSAPAAPASLSAAAPQASAALTWPAAQAATGYRVRKDGVTAPIYDGTGLTFTDTFPLGTSHTYTVTAYNTAGESALTAPITATALAASLSLTITPGTGVNNLSWLSDSLAANGYAVLWMPGSGLPVVGATGGVVARVAQGTLTWSDTSAYRVGLSAGSRYEIISLH